jgi:hypothetical protein
VKHNGAMHEPGDPLARMDAIATAALSGNSLARYHAYKEVLLARETNPESIASTLTLFVLDLAEAHDQNAVISRPRNET